MENYEVFELTDKEREDARKMKELGFRGDGTGTGIRKYIGKDKDVIIPDGIVKIYDDAFYDIGIKSVVFPDSLEEIGVDAFYNNYLSKVDLKNVKVVYRDAFGGNGITEFTYKGKTYNVKETDKELLREVGIL